MEAYLLEWLNLLGRWLHLIAGVAWIGASFYFVWLDNHLLPIPNPEKSPGVSGQVWAVHGGGFYNARKYPTGPDFLPEPLHWFKWEAYTTWLSGFFLLCLVYYVQADAYLIDRSVADIGPAAAIGIGLISLAGGWVVYDLLCRSPLAKNERTLAVVFAILIALAAYGLCHVFSGRGAFIHFGAMLGTIMVANVFFVIIPGQRELVRAKAEGRPLDPGPGLRGKQRSVHNTYFTLPVLFAMISNHYAGTYAARYNWLVLIALAAAGALIRAWFVARHKLDAGIKASPWPALAGVAILAVTIGLMVPQPETQGTAGPQAAADASIDFPHAQTIVGQRCAVCHAEKPTQPGFAAPPKGVMLDTPQRILAQTAQMRQQVTTRAMPLGNLTKMTDAERAELVAWIDHGAPH
jgi:uncharacterized membrane protein